MACQILNVGRTSLRSAGVDEEGGGRVRNLRASLCRVPRAQMPDGGRLALRLDVLSREQLCALAAAGCAADTKLCARADALIAGANPLPRWCVDVLLSPDVLSHVLGTLELCDGRVASVASAWAAGWAAMLAQRRYVNPKMRHVLLLRANEEEERSPCSITRMPDGTICLASFSTRPLTFHLPDSRCQRLPVREHAMRSSAWHTALTTETSPRGTDAKFVLCHGDVLYLSDYSAHRVTAFSAHLGVELAHTVVRCPQNLAHGNGKLLVGSWNHSVSRPNILVLDAQTLELQHKLEHFTADPAFTVCNSEVCVGGDADGEIQIYDFAGTLRRTLHGDFRRPCCITAFRGRLYIVEHKFSSENYEDEEDEPDLSDHAKRLAGHRVLVLSLDGEIIQEICPGHVYPGMASREGASLRQVSLDIHDGELHLLYRLWGGARLVVLKILGH